MSASIRITTTALPTGVVGRVYSAALLAEVSPQNSGVLWEIRNALPPYITLEPQAGVLSGQCNRSFWGSLHVVAQNMTTGEVDQVVLSLYVAQTSGLDILTGALDAATAGLAYAMPLAASGGLPPYAWHASDLPEGLTCTAANLVGTPTQAGDFSVLLSLSDTSNPAQQVSSTLPMRVNAALMPLRITTTDLLSGALGQLYLQALSAAGGEPPYTWSADNLPVGLQVQSANIAGKPTQSGQFSVQLQLADHHSTSIPVSTTLTLVVNDIPTALTVATAALSAAQTNVPYYQLLQGAGGVPPYQWSSDGLPIGLSIDGDAIVGQASVSGGSSPVTLTVTDQQQATASKFFLLAVLAG